MIRLSIAALSLAALAGCASLNTVVSDVSSHSQWPTGRQPGTYAFERLPSQQAQPDEQQRLEDAARAALSAAGFTEAAAGSGPDVSVQLGSRVTRYEPVGYYDPFMYGRYGWAWGPGYWRYPRFGLGLHHEVPRYDREVAVLIRDAKTGAVLYETHASNDTVGGGGPATLAAMFEAALKDFPQTAVNPRRISVPLAQQ